MTTPQRGAIYHRVSTIDQDPAGARRELVQAAKRYGCRVALNVEETGSGANNSRPGLGRVLEAARRGAIDAVFVWKLDRFGRSAHHMLGNIRKLVVAGVRYLASSQGIDIRPSGDSISRLLLTMLGAVAEFERSLIVERTRLGLAKARREGTRLGRPRVARPPRAEVMRLRAGARRGARSRRRSSARCGRRGCLRKRGVGNGGPNPRGNGVVGRLERKGPLSHPCCCVVHPEAIPHRSGSVISQNSRSAAATGSSLATTLQPARMASF